MSRAGLTAAQRAARKMRPVAVLNITLAFCAFAAGSTNARLDQMGFAVADFVVGSLLLAVGAAILWSGRTALAATDADRKERE